MENLSLNGRNEGCFNCLKSGAEEIPRENQTYCAKCFETLFESTFSLNGAKGKGGGLLGSHGPPKSKVCTCASKIRMKLPEIMQKFNLKQCKTIMISYCSHPHPQRSQASQAEIRKSPNLPLEHHSSVHNAKLLCTAKLWNPWFV